MKNRLALGIVFLFILGAGYFFLKSASNSPSQPQTNNLKDTTQPYIVSTKPDPLNETIIPADQALEITFNLPLQNPAEFKVRIEPKIDFKVELSVDRKTAKITPEKPFELGASYTLYIGPETKFDGIGNWGKDQSYHFRTVRYRGI